MDSPLVASKVLSGPEGEPYGEKARHGPRAKSACRIATCMASNNDYGVPDEAEARHCVASVGGGGDGGDGGRCRRRRRSMMMQQCDSLVSICISRHDARGRACQILFGAVPGSVSASAGGLLDGQKGEREERAVASMVGMSNE